MLALELYQTLNNDGVQLWAEGEKLRFAPKEKITHFLLAELKANKSELLLLLAANGPIKPVVQKTVRQLEAAKEAAINLDKYSHLVKCQQCKHLSLACTCTQKNGFKPIPQALRMCEKFTFLKSERTTIQAQAYTTTELNTLITRYEKPLFSHLLDCGLCDVEQARYCADGCVIGSVYDALLLTVEDSTNRRYALMNQVIKARVSGRRYFVPLESDNAPPPIQTAPTTRKYGNTPEYEAFINHWTACEVCKPNLNRYCSEGQKLKNESD